jgi:peptidoglycan/xylan/chitin deacetylase (PgdA/CDA1 family)
MKAILTYHSVDDSGSPISVGSEAFAGHVRWLRRAGVPVVTLDTLLASSDMSTDAVAVTFDDALVTAQPAIERLLGDGLPVTSFVVTGRVGQTNSWEGHAQAGIPTFDLMDWTDLEALRARGADLAPHTRSHPRLTRLADDAVDEEIGGSVEDLRQRVGSVSAHFAYPYGDVDDRVAARTAHHCRYAHTVEFRPLRAGESAMRLPRLDMYYFNRPEALDAWHTARFRARLQAIGARRWVAARVRKGVM